MDAMKAAKCIVVRKEVWADLSSMREPGMTLSELIEGLIEREKLHETHGATGIPDEKGEGYFHTKKRRPVEDIRRIQETEELVEIPL